MCATSATASEVPIFKSTSRQASSSWSRASSSSARSSAATVSRRAYPPRRAPLPQLGGVDVHLEAALLGEDDVQVGRGARQVGRARRLRALVGVDVVRAVDGRGAAGLALDEVRDLALQVL